MFEAALVDDHVGECFLHGGNTELGCLQTLQQAGQGALLVRLQLVSGAVARPAQRPGPLLTAPQRGEYLGVLGETLLCAAEIVKDENAAVPGEQRVAELEFCSQPDGRQ